MNTLFSNLQTKLQNSGRKYISDDHSNTGDETSAKLFQKRRKKQKHT